MKKVLLLDTSIGTLNIGDEIINISIKRNFPELFNNSYICNLPTHTPLFHWYQKFLYRNRNMKSYRNADYKILCGTNALYTNMLRPLPSWNIGFGDISLLKGTVCMGIGAGVNSKNVNFYTKQLYSRILNHDMIHSCRDDYTVDLLTKLGFKAANTSCPTMWGLTPQFCKTIPQKKSSKVIFTLTSYQPDISNDSLMIKTLEKCYEHLYFWPQTFEDLAYLKTLSSNKNIIVIPPNLQSYDRILDEEIDYVGNRLHGGIFSLQHANRSIIIAIDYRARNMAKKYGIAIIERKDMSTLEDYIMTEWPYEIAGIDLGLISTWKKQFEL